jgi:ABC-2 type transport system permease protein
MMALVRQQLRSELLSLLIWGGALGLLCLYVIYMYELIPRDLLMELEEMIQAMPPALRALYAEHGSYGTLSDWLIGNIYGGWILALFTVYTALAAAGLVAREMERRTIEFLLAMPVTRRQLLFARAAGLAAALGLLHLVRFGSVAASMALIGESISAGPYLLAELNSWLLFTSLGLLCLFFTLFVNDYGRAVGVTLGTGFGLLFLHLGTVSAEGALKGLRQSLLFARYNPAAILAEGKVPIAEMGGLLAVGALALLLAVLAFDRKQIAV